MAHTRGDDKSGTAKSSVTIENCRSGKLRRLQPFRSLRQALAKVHFVTYAVVFLVGALLAQLVLPGQYVATIDIYESGKYGPHWDLSYRCEHGWPFTFARKAPIFSNTPPYWRLSVWRFHEGLQEFHVAALLADAAVVVAILVAVGWLVERRRRRARRFQLTISSALLATTAIASLLGWYAMRRSEHFRERRTLAAIEGIRKQSTTHSYIHGIENDVIWQLDGPTWLRTIVGDRWFRHIDRVGSIETDGPELHLVSKLRHLKVVLIWGGASNEQLRQLEKLPVLEGLDMSSLNLDERWDEYPQGREPFFKLPRLARLRGLNVHGTSFWGVGPESTPALETLVAHETHVDDEGLLAIGRLSSLKVLDLGETSITNDGLAHLRGLAKLEQLWLGYNDLSDAGIVHLAALDNLRELGLCNTEVTDASISSLVKLRRLETLDVSETGISEKGVAKLKRALPGCKVY